MSIYKPLKFIKLPSFISEIKEKLTYNKTDDEYIRSPIENEECSFKTMNIKRIFEINSVIKTSYENLPIFTEFQSGYITNVSLTTPPITLIQSPSVILQTSLTQGNFIIIGSIRLTSGSSNNKVTLQIVKSIDNTNEILIFSENYPFTSNSTIINIRTTFSNDNENNIIQLVAFTQSASQNTIQQNTNLSILRIS